MVLPSNCSKRDVIWTAVATLDTILYFAFCLYFPGVCAHLHSFSLDAVVSLEETVAVTLPGYAKLELPSRNRKAEVALYSLYLPIIVTELAETNSSHLC